MKYIIKAVPQRRDFVNEILIQLPDAMVYWDEKHDSVLAYLTICKDLIKEEPCVLLEDDIILTSNFKEKIEKVINDNPDELISFFSISAKKPRKIKGSYFIFSQCVYHPQGFSQKILDTYPEWERGRWGKRKKGGSDLLMGAAWGWDRDMLLWVPSLVQHRQCESAIDPNRSKDRISRNFIP